MGVRPLGFAKLQKFVDIRHDQSFEFGVVNVAFDLFHEAGKVGSRYNLFNAFAFLTRRRVESNRMRRRATEFVALSGSRDGRGLVAS